MTMKIDRLEFIHVAMPLIYPWRTAYGEDAAIHAILCRMSSIQKAIGQTNPPICHDGIGDVCLRDSSGHLQMPVNLSAFVR